MKKTRIVIVDDHTTVRIGLKSLLNTQKDLEVVGEADNGVAAIKECLRLRPDVVIIDLMTTQMDGSKAVVELHDKAPNISPTVVREHITKILSKIDAANRTEAINIAHPKHLQKI